MPEFVGTLSNLRKRSQYPFERDRDEMLPFDAGLHRRLLYASEHHMCFNQVTDAMLAEWDGAQPEEKAA